MKTAQDIQTLGGGRGWTEVLQEQTPSSIKATLGLTVTYKGTVLQESWKSLDWIGRWVISLS